MNLRKSDLKFIITSFLMWRIGLFLILIIAPFLFPLQKDFLGGGLESYIKNPWLWSWANFDGEHFLAIAYQGYLPLTYFFFPLYPLATKLLSIFIGAGLENLNYSALIVSNLSFLVGSTGLYKLLRTDFGERVSKLTYILLLIFPTSFYFGSVYSESLFFALVVWSFYFARKKKWLFAGLLCGLGAITRLAGVALIPALVTEGMLDRKKREKLSWRFIFSIIVSVSGIFIYMYFLFIRTGDPLEFFHNVSIFGQQRSSVFVSLPQVFYRYVFKVLPNVSYKYFPAVLAAWMEFIVAVIFTLLMLISFFRLRISYAVYLTLGFLIPTLSGSFSSLPRYVIVLFPAFILIASWFDKRHRIAKVLLSLLALLMLFISCSLFLRGYWIS